MATRYRTILSEQVQLLRVGEDPDTVQAALGRWRFRPVLRGADPIEVNAVLGFNIDTRDVH